MKDSNIGETGLVSIRIDGRKVGDLPLGQGNQAKDGITEFLKTDKETKANNIAAKYPKHKLEVLRGQIRECRRNIKKMKAFKDELKVQIVQYRQLIVDTANRESELAKCAPDSDRAKELRLQYPPYDVSALNTQIEQFETTVNRCDDVIEQEHESIAEIERVLALVEQKERELKSL